MKVKQFVKEIFAQMKRDWYMPVTEHQVYDTTERVIGTYMGKPLYRKSLVINNVNNTNNSFVDFQGVADVETVVRCDYSSKRMVTGINETSWYTSSSRENPANINSYFISTRVSNGVLQYMVGGYGDQISSINVTIEYTKTTDTATTSKVPFEPLTEYSTEERMIGYWIDGKPLYRKVFVATGNVNFMGNTFAESAVPGITDVYAAIKDDVDYIVFHYLVSRDGTTTRNRLVGFNKANGNLGQTDNSGVNFIGFGVRTGDAFILEYTKTTD